MESGFIHGTILPDSRGRKKDKDCRNSVDIVDVPSVNVENASILSEHAKT